MSNREHSPKEDDISPNTSEGTTQDLETNEVDDVQADAHSHKSVLVTEQDLETNGEDEESDTNSRKRVIVTEHGLEKSIRLLLVVENFRLIFYLIFFFMIILGVILTKTFVEGDYEATIRDAFGIASICVFFDHPPSTYFLPSIYATSLVVIHAYAIVSVFRVWVATEEGKVSKAAFIAYVIGFFYVLISFTIFTTVFAVQPIAHDPSSMRIHTAPYTNLIVALWVLAVLVTWFGDKIAWKHLDIPRGMFIVNWVMVACQSIVVPVKLIQHINTLGDLEEGLWWDPMSSGWVITMIGVFDNLFLVTVLLWPTMQSAYLSYRGHTTHCVYLSLEDNREACIPLYQKYEAIKSFEKHDTLV